MKKVAIIGCGALSQVLAKNLPLVLPQSYRISGVMAHSFEHASLLAEKVDCRACRTLDELLEDSPDIVVEMASADAVRQYAEVILSRGFNLVVVSIGALVEKALRDRLTKAASQGNSRLYLPNGAIGGLDLMQTYALMGDAQLSIENIKSPTSLNGAPYLEGKELSMTHETVVFEGTVHEAIAGFPKNVNVAVAASLAAATPQASVIIRSVPGTKENTHIVRLSNPRMRAELSFSSQPDPQNPKSSTSTAWSVMALLKNLASPISFF